jgi:hypothetical protein
VTAKGNIPKIKPGATARSETGQPIGSSTAGKPTAPGQGKRVGGDKRVGGEKRIG